MKGESGFGSGGEVRVRMAIGPGQWRPLPWAPRFRRPFSGPPQGPLPQESTGLRDLPTQSLCTPFETTPRLPGILEYLLKHAEPASGSVGPPPWFCLLWRRLHSKLFSLVVHIRDAQGVAICRLVWRDRAELATYMHAHEALYGRRWEVGVRMGQGPETFTCVLAATPTVTEGRPDICPQFWFSYSAPPLIAFTVVSKLPLIACP